MSIVRTDPVGPGSVFAARRTSLSLKTMLPRVPDGGYGRRHGPGWAIHESLLPSGMRYAAFHPPMHAVARAPMFIVLMPKTRAKNVLTWPVSATWIAVGELHVVPANAHLKETAV